MYLTNTVIANCYYRLPSLRWNTHIYYLDPKRKKILS